MLGKIVVAAVVVVMVVVLVVAVVVVVVINNISFISGRSRGSACPIACVRGSCIKCPTGRIPVERRQVKIGKTVGVASPDESLLTTAGRGN